MKKPTIFLFTASILFCLFTADSVTAQHRNPPAKDETTARACVIGGMTMTGLWQEISNRFTAKTGIKVKVVITGPRPSISVPFRNGEADLLVMHSGDITTDLVLNGYGINMRACAQNDIVLLGPASDPAGIAGMKDGALALQKIVETGSKFLDGWGIGKREVSQKMWRKARIKPRGEWFIKDDSIKKKRMLEYASQLNAYVMFGRMPVHYRKIEYGNLKIMVEDDPAMRRPYVVMEANPKRFPHTNSKGARALSNFILSEEVQRFMKEYGVKESGKPWFYPVWPYNV